MTTLTHEPGRRTRFRQRPRFAVWLEGAVLLVAAPFLLFPTFYSPMTAAALAALGGVWLWSALTRQEAIVRPTPFDLALLPFGLAVVIGILASADPEQTFSKATGVILGLGVWRFVAAFAADRARVNAALAAYVALGTGLAIAGFLGLTTIPKVPLLTALAPGQYWSPPDWLGLETHPNQLAGLLCLLLPLMVALLANWRAMPPWPRRILAFLTLFNSVILVLTQSRGGWIGVGAGLVVLAALWAAVAPASPRRRATRIALVAGALAVAALLITAGPERLQSFWLDPPTETAVGSLETLSYRQDLWPGALQAAEDFWLTGIGLGAFREAAFRLYLLPDAGGLDIGHAHNIFLQVALDVGVVGLVSYLALLAVAAASALSVARRSGSLRPEALGLLAGLVALHVYGMADALVLGAKPGFLFWYTLGLLAALVYVARRPDGPRPTG